MKNSKNKSFKLKHNLFIPINEKGCTKLVTKPIH